MLTHKQNTNDASAKIADDPMTGNHAPSDLSRDVHAVIKWAEVNEVAMDRSKAVFYAKYLRKENIPCDDIKAGQMLLLNKMYERKVAESQRSAPVKQKKHYQHQQRHRQAESGSGSAKKKKTHRGVAYDEDDAGSLPDDDPLKDSKNRYKDTDEEDDGEPDDEDDDSDSEFEDREAEERDEDDEGFEDDYEEEDDDDDDDDDGSSEAPYSDDSNYDKETKKRKRVLREDVKPPERYNGKMPKPQKKHGAIDPRNSSASAVGKTKPTSSSSSPVLAQDGKSALGLNPVRALPKNKAIGAVSENNNNNNNNNDNGKLTLIQALLGAWEMYLTGQCFSRMDIVSQSANEYAKKAVFGKYRTANKSTTVFQYYGVALEAYLKTKMGKQGQVLAAFIAKHGVIGIEGCTEDGAIVKIVSCENSANFVLVRADVAVVGVGSAFFSVTRKYINAHVLKQLELGGFCKPNVVQDDCHKLCTSVYSYIPKLFAASVYHTARDIETITGIKINMTSPSCPVDVNNK